MIVEGLNIFPLVLNYNSKFSNGGFPAEIGFNPCLLVITRLQYTSSIILLNILSRSCFVFKKRDGSCLSECKKRKFI
jgi:hypothetical protein